MNGDLAIPRHPDARRYRNQARDLVESCESRDLKAMGLVRRYHPRLEGRPDTNDRNGVTDAAIREIGLTLADAECIIARQHQFENWREFEAHLEALNESGSVVSQFEAAVDATIKGDVPALKRLIRENPELIRMRSTRMHRATLLHYVGANGVEGYRQKTPLNAVSILKILLRAGAEVDADLDYEPLGKLYPERRGSTTLGLVATSYHPAAAGVQTALLDVLLRNRASVNGLRRGWNPLIAALHNGRGDAAAFLARRGARTDLEGAAGAGRLDRVRHYFKKDGGLKAGATQAQLTSGFMWACQYGRTKVAALLLEKDLNVGIQLHGATGLHWAAYGGHPDLVSRLLKAGARVEINDKRYNGTPLAWALYGWANPPPEARRVSYHGVVEVLAAAGARVTSEWLAARGLDTKLRKDRRMFMALSRGRCIT